MIEQILVEFHVNNYTFTSMKIYLFNNHQNTAV